MPTPSTRGRMSHRASKAQKNIIKKPRNGSGGISHGGGRPAKHDELAGFAVLVASWFYLACSEHLDLKMGCALANLFFPASARGSEPTRELQEFGEPGKRQGVKYRKRMLTESTYRKVVKKILLRMFGMKGGHGNVGSVSAKGGLLPQVPAGYPYKEELNRAVEAARTPETRAAVAAWDVARVAHEKDLNPTLCPPADLMKLAHLSGTNPFLARAGEEPAALYCIPDCSAASDDVEMTCIKQDPLPDSDLEEQLLELKAEDEALLDAMVRGGDEAVATMWPSGSSKMRVAEAKFTAEFMLGLSRLEGGATACASRCDMPILPML